MATARARHGSYIFQRPGSANWYVQLRSGGKRTEKSLGTADKLEAEIIAAPMIAAHKAALLAARPRLVTVPHKLTPGEYTVDGERVIATEREIIYFDQAGKLLRTEPNGPALKLENLPAGAVLHFGNPTQPLAELQRKGPVIDVSKLERAAKRNDDDAIIETYLNHRNITGYDRREAETVWALYKSITDSKPLKDATRDDGRLLVKRFQNDRNKSATITKKVGWLRAAVELAIDEGKLKFNPFSNIVPANNDDELQRLPLDDADMKACRKNLDSLSEPDALLYRIAAPLPST